VPESSVRFGDTIGKVGATGGNYAPHLHYETHQATGDDPPQASADGVLWPQGKPPVVDPFEVQDFSDLSRYTFGIDDPRVRRVVEGYIRKKFGQRRSGEVSGTGPDFDKKVREAAVRGAANSMSVDQLAKLSDEDFSWATEGDYWRQIMDPAFRP